MGIFPVKLIEFHLFNAIFSQKKKNFVKKKIFAKRKMFAKKENCQKKKNFVNQKPSWLFLTSLDELKFTN